LRNVKSPYLGNRLSDRHKIWYGLAHFQITLLHQPICTTLTILPNKIA